MPHTTIVTLSRLVQKVPSLELLHATEFSMRLGMIDFLDNADKLMCKIGTAPSDLPASQLLCQI